jgi:hypothetical protein
LPLTLRRRWRWRESNPLLLGANEVLCRQSFIPKVRTDGFEPPQHEATRLQRAELTYAQRPLGRVTDRIRTGTREAHDLGCCRYTTVTTKGTGTIGLEPTTSRLTSERSVPLSYVPKVRSAGGIRTHDLELMRLARTASPLPRKSGRQESNLRSPVPETGGVANSPTARRSTPGGARTRSLRVEGPASFPFDHGGVKLRRQESNLRLASNSRASYRSTTPE